MKETIAGYIVGDSHMEFTTAEPKWIRKVKRWAKERPEEVQITHENKDGSILANLPVNYFKISPKQRRDVSDEQRLASSERMRIMRQKQTKLI